MSQGITLQILGDFGPFSRMGKSIGYKIAIGGESYLIDCGAPLFQQIGGHGLQEIDGLIVTHCHDDHKRWFTDLALFNMYAPDVGRKISLMTSEDVHNDIVTSSMPALGRSLSSDSTRVIEFSYEDYVEHRLIGPRAKYQIASVGEGGAKSRLCVLDRKGRELGPDEAKICINPKTGRARMLFKAPDYGEWVEPESFYTFSSNTFYEEEKNLFYGNGFSIEAIKAHVWHGVAGIGLRVRTAEETLVISSDTAHNMELWKKLYTRKMARKAGTGGSDFEKASVIHGDINDYIERCWSQERYREALGTFRDAVVVHDISAHGSVVHTDYERLGETALKKELTLLTHSPDRITSEWVLCDTEKVFLIKGRRFFEVVGEDLFPMDADIYHKEGGKYYAGYKSRNGKYTVYEKEGLLRFSSYGNDGIGAPVFKVDLYQDISGKYFPKIDGGGSFYFERGDGRVERIEVTEEGSTGKIVENDRPRLSPGYEKKTRESKEVL